MDAEAQCEDVVNLIVERVRSSGKDDAVCKELREHFARLPDKYTLNIDVQRHEDVLLHMRLLQQAREMQESSDCSGLRLFVNARKVQLGNGNGQESSTSQASSESSRVFSCSIGSGTARVHPSALYPPPMFSTSSSWPGEHEEQNGNVDCNPWYGYELTFASSDRHGLLKHFTSALSNPSLDLNIKEAHVFSTTDGMALEVFVVEGWAGDDPEELKQAVLSSLSNIQGPTELREAAERIAYEDWAVDYDQLVIGERLGGGSSGRLYRGKYLSQEVAIKIIMLDDGSISPASGSLCAAPAADLLQVFRQEVSIMRLVRHKNLVQFIGACARWPKLCIVTELMAGGSVRGVLDKRGCGLDVESSLKVLRDAARGMDFLHRRGIVHRDLKCANLLIDEHEVVKVCDFGVARQKPSHVNVSGSGNWPAEMTAETGTYRWMSPEVLEHKAYDHKTDIYSFGIMIWELLTGQVPYSGLTPLQAAIGVVQRRLRPEMPAGVPEKLKHLAQRCWDHDPQLRPEFSEVLATLEEMMLKRSSSAWRRPFFRKKK